VCGKMPTGCSRWLIAAASDPPQREQQKRDAARVPHIAFGIALRPLVGTRLTVLHCCTGGVFWPTSRHVPLADR
jgi:hypothetical protein